MSENINDTVKYDADIYVRLSDEDGDKPESNSITNQKSFIREYFKSMPEIRVRHERADDGFSGVDFFRPAFQDMLEDIRAGEINCVVVKDLSRFGRNYIETGKLLNEFAGRGVRFIAINDGYDSAVSQGQAQSIILPIKNLINDSYSRDISMKIRSHLEVKKRRGEFVGAFAGYGYMKDAGNKNRLVIDEYAAGIVRDIFRWKIEGMSQQGISDRLNSAGILSPAEYKRSLGMKYHTGFKSSPQAKWTAVAVGRILKNPLYTGVMVQGKTGSPNYKVKKTAPKPEESWIRVENTHEAVISEADFRTVNGLLKSDTRIAPAESTVYPFSGLIFCADCKQSMVRKTVPAGGKKYLYYTCSANRADKCACTTHNISEKRLAEAVEAAIKAHIESVVNMERELVFLASLPAQESGAKKIDAEIARLKAEHERNMRYKMSAYESYVNGVLSEKDYKTYHNVYTRKCEGVEKAIENRRAELEAVLNVGDSRGEWIAHFKAFRFAKDILKRNCLVRIINKIWVYEGGRIEIVFQYHNEYKTAAAYIGQRTDMEENRNRRAV